LSLQRELLVRTADLERIKRSFAWRLLSRYGRIKYRYLLPIYRLLRLLPPEPEQSASSNGLDVSEQRTVGAAAEQQPPTAEIPRDFYESLIIRPTLRDEDVPRILQERPKLRRQKPDVVCFSIIDWEFRYQRPQQVMSQFAAHGHRVFYISTSRFV